MSIVTWTVTDTDEGVDLEDWSIRSADVPGSPGGWSVAKHRLVGGVRDGVSVIEVDNGEIAFTIVPTRGMGIHRATANDRMLGWRSPVRGPVHPRFVPIAEPGGLGWLDGFDELLVRCGLHSNGAPEFDDNGTLMHPLHGRIANRPARRVTVTVDADAGTIAVAGVVDETRFLFHSLELTATIVTRFGESGFAVNDEVRNASARPTSFQLLYHINIGSPLLEAGAELIVPAKQVVPRNEHAAEDVSNRHRYDGPQAGFEERVYFYEPAADADGNTGVVLHNAAQSEAVGLRFNTRQLPCFSQWKNTAALEDGYVTGIEPATNFPNPRGFEAGQGRVVELAPGDSYAVNLQLNWLRDADAVQREILHTSSFQDGVEPRVCDAPLPEWCAGA